MTRDLCWRNACILTILTTAITSLRTTTGLATARESTPSSPSVLLVTIDTLRADHLRYCGYRQIETPAIDRLAAEGVRFESAYCQVPLTLPSHAVILTGTYPMFNGVRDFTSHGLPPNIPTIAEILHRHGYETAAFVSSFALNSVWGLNRGFDVYDDDVGVTVSSLKSPTLFERRGDRTVDRLLAWLERVGSRPFFAWLHLYDPHSPYQPPEPYRTQYATHPYDGEIAFDDAQFGRVMTKLQELNLASKTAIFLLSDHGESLGEHGEVEHGFFVYNATLRVPLIVRLPDGREAGRTFSEPVGTIDVAPTIAQLCGVPGTETASFQGRSLLAALAAGGTSEEVVYAESFYPRDSFGWHELRTLLTRRYKYIDAPRAEIYDLRVDPGETSNLFGRQTALVWTFKEKLQLVMHRFAGEQMGVHEGGLDPESIEKLKSLGYIVYKAPTPVTDAGHLADPKDKITLLYRILHAANLMRGQKHVAADELLSQLERAEPKLYTLPFLRGENALDAGNPKRAVEEFDRASSLNPTFDPAAYGLGRAHFLLGQYKLAAASLERALQLNPRNFLARLALAEVYWREELPAKAEPELAQVLKERPELPEVHANYAIVLAKIGKYQDALPHFERARAMEHKDAKFYNYLGITYGGLGRREEAMQAYKQAVATDPHYADAYLNLALEYRKQNHPEMARYYFQKTCEFSEELCRQYAGQLPPDSR